MIQFNSAGGIAGTGQLPNGKSTAFLPDTASSRAQSQVQENSNAKSARGGGEPVNLSSSVQSKYDAPEQVLQNFDPNAVVEKVTGVLEQALKRAAANGASPEELEKMQAAAQKGIDKGFAEAQDIIKGLGLMSDELATTIDSARDGIRDRLGDFTSQLIEGAVASGSAAVEASAVRAERSEQNSFAFSVTTADGDVVTINASREQSSRFEALDKQTDSARELMVSWQDERAERFTFSVEGDLDESELDAIEALMAKVGTVADTFFSGQYEAAFEKAERLELGGDALVSMSLNMTQKTMAVAEYSAMSAGSSGRPNASAEWLMPIKQYAQGLGELQRSQPDLLDGSAWLDMLQAHPKQNAAMIDFADLLNQRQPT